MGANLKRDRPGALPAGWGPPLAVVLLLAIGCAGPLRAMTPPLPGPPAAEARRLRGIPDQPTIVARGLDLPARPSGRGGSGGLAFEAAFVLHADDERFGGLSGLWLAPDATHLLTIGDRGQLWQAALDHDARGRLIGVGDWRRLRLGTAPGDPGGRYGGDAEALANDDRRGLVIAYESAQRLRRFDLDDLRAAPARLPTPSELATPSNEGIEALVGLADGALLAITEGYRDARGDLLGWRIDGDVVEPLGYVATEGFVPTGATRLDDVVYLVERRFSLLGGFATRLVALPADRVRAGARLRPVELGRFGLPILSENFEGVAARRGPDGQVLLYLIADDNFTPLQRTVLVQLALVDDTASASGQGEGVGPAHQGAERQEQ
jgi:hypothetical protein